MYMLTNNRLVEHVYGCRKYIHELQEQVQTKINLSEFRLSGNLTVEIDFTAEVCMLFIAKITISRESK